MYYKPIKHLSIFLLAGCYLHSNAQNNEGQIIRGRVVESSTQQGLHSASIYLIEPALSIKALTDSNGFFTLGPIPVGRAKFGCSFMGFQPYESDYLILNIAKEPYLEIGLTAMAYEGMEILVKSMRNPKMPANALSLVSTRSFNPEETQRFAASVNDPSRMAMSFPGVQATRDARSDIVIRGNNPMGMLWRLEGVDIPNPNHFARRGSSGGGITMFSTALLDNSDFSTGAFAAEYGDALSGVFDMRFRKGNNQKSEKTFKASLIGLDIATEGPIKKGESSYLVNYRYSTLGLLNNIGLNLVGERENNTFTDIAFNLHFAKPGSKASWNIWGIGGYSKETFDPVEEVTDWKQYDDYAIYDFRTKMGAIGVGHQLSTGKHSYLKTSLSMNAQQIDRTDDTLNTAMAPFTVSTERTTNYRLTLSSIYNSRLHQNVQLKSGVFINRIGYELLENQFNHTSQRTDNVIDGDGSTWQLQPFVQLNFKVLKRLTVNPGLHVLHLSLNGNTTVEPRLAMQFKPASRHTIGAAYGRHGKTLPLGSYFFKQAGGNSLPNMDLDHIVSNHYVLAYDWLFAAKWRFHVEGYLQEIEKVPVSPLASGTYYLLNQIDGFADRALVSKGNGRNKGIDFQVERFFSKGWFMLGSFSIFDAKYQPLNGQWYNTLFNSKQSGSLTATREWSFTKNRVLQLGGKAIYNGGYWLTPLLAGAAQNSREPMLDESRPFSEQVRSYFRTDMRLSWRRDKSKLAWQIGLDVQNIFGVENIDGLSRRFDPVANQWIFRKQSGLVPVLSYQVDF